MRLWNLEPWSPSLAVTLESSGLDEGPGHAVETAGGLKTELVKGSRGEVEVEHGTASAAVHGHDLDRFALV